MLREFRDFAMRGNVVDLAVGVIIGAAFGTIVSSLVDDVIMPPIGLALAGIDFSTLKLVLQQATAAVGTEGAADFVAARAEVAINYGKFINAALTAMRCSHVESNEPSSKVGRARNAERKASCMASLASSSVRRSRRVTASRRPL